MISVEMSDPYQQTTSSRAALSPALRGVLDALDDTRTVAEVQALMKPYFEDKNCGADTVWRVWNEEKDKAEREERRRRPRHWSKKSICRSRMWGRIQQVVRRPKTAIETMTERGFPRYPEVTDVKGTFRILYDGATYRFKVPYPCTDETIANL